ncbi:MAG: hypothetical protein H6Q74_2772 [Firmicutes bacterium]|nr:hypothetical protein [Bacillota bacterium]
MSSAKAKLLGALKSIERVDIMAVHEYVNVKYEQLSKEYKLKAEPIPPERQEQIKNLFEQYGLNVQLGG